MHLMYIPNKLFTILVDLDGKRNVISRSGNELHITAAQIKVKHVHDDIN